MAGNAISSSITACSNAAKHDIVNVMVGVTNGEDEEWKSGASPAPSSFVFPPNMWDGQTNSILFD